MAKYCKMCDIPLSETAKFCPRCGAPAQGESCPQCGAALVPGGSFCAGCGAPRPAPAPRPPEPAGAGGPPSSVPSRAPQKRAKRKTAGIVAIIASGLALVLLFVFVIGPNISQWMGSKKTGFDDPSSPGSDANGFWGSDKAANEGLATYKDVDPDSVIETEKWGYVPANQIIVVFKDDVDKAAAKKVIGQIGGTVVGELELINMYQLETADKTEAALNATLDAVSGMDGVELVFPNVPAYLSDTAGTPCSPLKDPAYADPANAHYNIIGMENAWKILKGSGVPLNKVNVGVLDEAFYTGSDEFNGKVKLSGDTTKDPVKKNNQIVDGGFTHGTMVAHVIGADAENSGMVGVAGVLGENLSINVKNVFDANPHYTPVQADPQDITQITYPNGVAYTDKTLVYLKRMVAEGATVINCSFNFKPPSDDYEPIKKAYEKFFKKIQETKPNVIFVASAGNSGSADGTQGALNGKNDCPAGIKLPNVITVGAVKNDGSRADFSNFATGDAEVTLSAPGVEMIVGTDENGQPIKANGTSFSAPQVASAIALIQSINPDLNAEQVKELLVKTSAPGITTGDQSIPIPAGMGAGVLRVDQAVLQAINDMREKQKLPPFDMQQLLDISTVTLTAKGSGLDYTLTAHIPASLGSSADVKIEVTGQHVLKGDTTQSVPVGSDATWEITLDKDEVFVRVKRLDNGACAYMTLTPEVVISGVYNVSGTITTALGDGDASTDPINAFQVRIEQTGNSVRIVFLDARGYILSGSYDPSTKTFTGQDKTTAVDAWTSTPWQKTVTTIAFTIDGRNVTGAGRVGWEDEAGVLDRTNLIIFKMEKVSE